MPERDRSLRGSQTQPGRDSVPEPRHIARPGRSAALVVVVPSHTHHLGLIRELTRRLAEGAGFDTRAAGRLALAVDEATTNVIEHAYRGSPDGRVEIRFDDAGQDFRVEVIDGGLSLDLRTLPRVDVKRFASERRTGGLGVHLMERIMDSVTYRRRARRNVCCLAKRKPRETE
jgi:serine/threonine-protein kinase RsbW